MAFKDDVFKELLRDEYFIQWLIAPDHDSNQYWNNWLAANPDKAHVLKEIKAVVNAIEPKKNHYLNKEEKDEVLGQVMKYAAEKSKLKKIQNEKEIGNRVWKGKVLMAACFVILALLTANYFGVFNNAIEKEVQTVGKLITKQTPKGTKSSFYLPDGTLVKLNASSKLEFPATFSDTLREVKLIGQGFFEVTRNEEAPFIVKTENLNVQVLGTSFDILSYPNSDRFEVAVASGRVEVGSRQGYLEILTKHEMTKLNPTTGKLTKSTFDPSFQIGWKDGILSFNDLSFDKVFDQLEIWYGVDIQVSDGIDLRKKYTGKYDNENLENVLIGMSSIQGFSFEIKGKRVKIFS
ncbi:FecR family protein [Echinicola sp. CAU 1574]|uniref:FecR family protein n=1 Tax=Echinicola arenosa TaxID=2774144 RepID=A0ABR9AFZ6_9BACT|nr:FecR family protein [Echinicola arenosa]MBD8487785.1 FecR family protein [Echinicola arenosa]